MRPGAKESCEVSEFLASDGVQYVESVESVVSLKYYERWQPTRSTEEATVPPADSVHSDQEIFL